MAVPLTLKVFKGDQLVATKDFDRDIIKIGRLASAHLTLEDDKVARIHAVIDVAHDGSLSVTDMGTTEGTLLNGKRVMKSTIAFGDSLTLGGTTIVVEKAGASSSVAPDASVLPEVPAQGAAVLEQMLGVVPQAVTRSVVVPPPAPPPSEPEPELIVPEPSAPPLYVQEEQNGAQVRARPRRRKGSGPLGVELRFLWGDTIVAEHFLHPDVESTFTVGTGEKVQFVMGDAKLGGPSFDVVRFGKNGANLRFTDKMVGELHRKMGDEVVPVEEARSRGLAQPDGDGFQVTLAPDDFAWVDLGGVVVEVFFQPAPKPVFVPFTDSVDFTVLNIFLVMFFLGALFVISAANMQAEGDEFADDLSAGNARMAKLLIKPPEQKNPILEKYEKKKESGEMAAKHKGSEGQMGKKDAPKRSAHAAPKGDPNNKDQARMLMAKVFGGSSGGISTVFGHNGLGGELKSAMGNMFGAAAGDAQGFGGLGLRGSGAGGGGVGDSIGIGGIGTRGRGGGTGGYGSGVGQLGGRRDVDIGITSSEPTVMGSLDKELIRKVIHANRGQIRYCYESQLTRNPKLNGKVAIKFIISAQGTVASASVAQSTVNNAELEACVAGRVHGWQFPKPKGGGVVVVTYPFIFQQSGG